MFQSIFQCVLIDVSIHVSIYVSIIIIDTKGIILFYNYKFVSRVDFTSVLLEVLLVF